MRNQFDSTPTRSTDALGRPVESGLMYGEPVSFTLVDGVWVESDSPAAREGLDGK